MSNPNDFVIVNGMLKKYTGPGGDVIIPDGVASIGWYAFKGCSGLTSVTIPGSVTKIGNEAFRSCGSLTSITIPGSVTEIGSSAFRGCVGLMSVTISNSVTKKGNDVFKDCAGLTSINISDSVTEIGINLFSGCKSLASITIPDGVKRIGKNAFSGCTGLTSINLPDSVTEIGENAFEGCAGLTSVTIPDSVTEICINVFSGCKSLASITIPDGVAKIGQNAFSDCKSLTSLIIPDSVTAIGINAFKGCRNLASITIGNGIREIPDRYFSDLTGLTSVSLGSGIIKIDPRAFMYCLEISNLTVDKNNTIYYSENNCIIEKESKKLIRGCKNSIIPDGVTVIGCGAFKNCAGLTSIAIPDSVTEIGAGMFLFTGAFEDCTDLTSITIPDSVTKINWGSFIGCFNAIITLYGNIIPEYGWFISTSSEKPKCRIYCPEIHISDIPSQLKISAVAGFAEKCDSSVKEEIKNGYTDYLRKQRKNYYPLFGDHPALLNFYTENKLIPVDEVPGLLESLKDTEIKAVLLEYSNSFSEKEQADNHKKQEKQQRDEFEKAVGLKEFTADDYKKMFLFRAKGNELEIRGYKSSNSNIVIPEYIGKKKVTSIGESAFESCAGLSSVTISDSVTGIGERAFFGCSGLSSVDFGNAVKKIGSRAFSGCSGLTIVNIPDSVNEIDTEAFSDCTGLTSVTIPDNIAITGDSVFSGCVGLAGLNIPKTVLDSVREEYDLSSKEFQTALSIVKTGFKLKDSEVRCSETIAAIMVAEYIRIWNKEHSTIPGYMSTVDVLDRLSGMISIPICDTIINEIDKDDHIEFLKKGIEGKNYRYFIIPFCIYADEKDIDWFIAKIREDSKGKAQSKHRANSSETALLLSDTKTAALYFDNKKMLYRYEQLRGIR